jgi:lysophospholipase L1-like esterase
MARSQKKTPAKSSPLYVKLVGAVVSLFVFVVVAELALRIVEADLYYKNQFFPINRDIDLPDVYEKDSKLFWRFRRDFVTESKMFHYLSYRINSDGMRGPEIKQQKTGYRIIALGNSCTFGWGMPYENTWVFQLQQMLNQRVPNSNVEVINAGVPGYSSHQGKIFFAEELLGLRPDMVLIMFGWNDHWKAGQGITDARQQTPHWLILATQNLFSRLKLYQILRKTVLSLTEKKKPIALDDVLGPRRVSMQEFYENLKSIFRLARNNKIVPVLLIPPIASRENYPQVPGTNLHQLHWYYQQQAMRVAEHERVPIVNLQAVFDQYHDLYDTPRVDMIHFNIKGHTVAATAIADRIIPFLVP